MSQEVARLFSAIPDEIICEIVKFLDFNCFRSIVFLSKRFSKLCLSDYMIKYYVFRIFPGRSRIQTIYESLNSWINTLEKLKEPMKYMKSSFWHGTGDKDALMITFNPTEEVHNFSFVSENYGSGFSKETTFSGIIEKWEQVDGDQEKETIHLRATKKRIVDSIHRDKEGLFDCDILRSISVTLTVCSFPYFEGNERVRGAYNFFGPSNLKRIPSGVLEDE